MSNEQCCFTTKPESNGDDCCTVQPKGKTQCPVCGIVLTIYAVYRKKNNNCCEKDCKND